MNEKKLKKAIYQCLVDSHPLVSEEYAYAQGQGQHGVAGKAREVLRLNWKYRICKKKPGKLPPGLPLPEGRATRLPPAGELARRLSGHQVISFDVFDTLILRAVEKPRDVFRLLEGQRGQPGFARMREEAEREARAQKGEVTIADIYGRLSDVAVSQDEGAQMEFEVEQAVCYANPYMQAVCHKLIAMGKRVIAVSDMYYPKEQMRALLDGCGYGGIAEVYVSCDSGRSKAAGTLQRFVAEREGRRLSYIHVGDQYHSDVAMSRRAGWDTFYYPNIQRAGGPYRRKEMRSIAASFYKGLVNARLHAGACHSSAYYEYGYAYGGILAAGFCRHLDQTAKKDGVDLFLFAARDGFLPYHLCKKYYPSLQSAYIPYSRFAAYQITMERSWKLFLESTVRPRTHLKRPESLGQAMEACRMGWVGKYLDAYGLSADMPFGKEAYQAVWRIFSENIHEALTFYAEQETAAQAYFRSVIKGCKNLCVVDIGWQGTSAASLRYFLQEKCGMDVQVSGALLGMCGNEAAGISLDTKLVSSYLFSTGMNHENMLRHSGRQTRTDFRNLLAEILFTEDAPTFLGYGLDAQGNVELLYGRRERNGRMVREIQKGICDFCRDYMRYVKKYGDWLDIYGQEAYLPLDALAGREAYCRKLFAGYEVHHAPGYFESHQMESLKEV